MANLICSNTADMLEKVSGLLPSDANGSSAYLYDGSQPKGGLSEQFHMADLAEDFTIRGE